MTDWAKRYAQAHLSNTPFDNVQGELADASIADAYAIQAAFADRLPGTRVGYKAALTAQPAQQSMDITEPVSGVLFDWGVREAAAPVTAPRPILLETELGYRLNSDITAPVQPDSVVGLMASCQPMIEIASPNLAGKPTGVDLIAANAASYAFIEGAAHDVYSLDLDSISVTFTRNGSVLHHDSAASVLEGQSNALSWLINHLLARAQPLQRGMLLMTGAMGPPHPATSGSYRADFGPLGVIEFSVTGSG